MAKTDVKFVKMEKGFETIKPRTFRNGLEGMDGFGTPFLGVRTWNLL
jgi:hypothetical protein